MPGTGIPIPNSPLKTQIPRDTAGPVGRESEPVAIPWRSLYRSRQIRLIVAMYFCYAWGSWFFMSWFPTYLVRGRGLTIREMGFYSAFPFIFGAAGNFIGGHLSDFLVRRHGLKLGRRLIGSAALAAAGLLVLDCGADPWQGGGDRPVAGDPWNHGPDAAFGMGSLRGRGKGARGRREWRHEHRRAGAEASPARSCLATS